jgi:hypothetical protein
VIRITAKLFFVTLALTAFLHVGPLFAAPVTWISSTGSDANSCTAAQPCATLFGALGQLDVSGGQTNCLDSPGIVEANLADSNSFTLDCAGVYEPSDPSSAALQLTGVNQVVKIRNLTISGSAGGYPAIKVLGSGTLIIENCVFENLNASGAGPALDIEPNGPFNLVITNSRISNNAGGVLLKPSAGGSVTATFDGVTIVNNGGGLKTDTTNGAVKVDISNSTISNNTNNGMTAVGGAGGTNILNLSHDVIASNGAIGIEVSGANVAAFVDTTLLDLNATGATSTLNSGKVYTYSDNRIIGPAGSGFTGAPPLQ